MINIAFAMVFSLLNLGFEFELIVPPGGKDLGHWHVIGGEWVQRKEIKKERKVLCMTWIKASTGVLNSRMSFSLTHCHTLVKEPSLSYYLP